MKITFTHALWVLLVVTSFAGCKKNNDPAITKAVPDLSAAAAGTYVVTNTSTEIGTKSYLAESAPKVTITSKGENLADMEFVQSPSLESSYKAIGVSLTGVLGAITFNQTYTTGNLKSVSGTINNNALTWKFLPTNSRETTAVAQKQ
ncbi:hypothetical protein [Fibrella aestuarina]|uniref:hypothetical protein n=1 Tax=Fibrella aestuarina TaxID=651143 RepID=UPI00059E7634|nr:hypothetical protein [Fibrella aestuarina]